MQQDSSLDMRTKILNAAIRLFSKQGFGATTVRQICEEAGANVALVSYYFGGKENVFYSIVDEYFPSAEMLEKSGEVLRDPIAGLMLLIEQITVYRTRAPDVANIIEQEILMRSPRMEYIQSRAFPVWTKLRDLLQKGREQGVFHFRSLDSTLMMVLGSLLFYKRSYYFSPLFTEGEQTMEDRIHDTIRYVFNGLGASGHLPES
ncbi:TetR family transcriptional regulator [Paenibacillus alkalitolerans]|uniref:TetR family transcriptional regulator n=1 Tax=Paenibacillus alkalitolerans TaxID=2799335 RepID=UPI0018F3387A|nr:TetR family transcriptional regulator [Paenibacillus alkalitolerans]